MEGRPSKEISAAEAVLVGALSSGVNAPTWSVLKITFLLLALCFTAMLALAFSSKNCDRWACFSAHNYWHGAICAA